MASERADARSRVTRSGCTPAATLSKRPPAEGQQGNHRNGSRMAASRCAFAVDGARVTRPAVTIEMARNHFPAVADTNGGVRNPSEGNDNGSMPLLRRGVARILRGPNSRLQVNSRRLLRTAVAISALALLFGWLVRLVERHSSPSTSATSSVLPAGVGFDAAKLRDWVQTPSQFQAEEENKFSDAATATLLRAVHEAYLLGASSPPQPLLSYEEGNLALRGELMATFPVRRRMLMLDSGVATEPPPGPSCDGEATMLERLWSAHGGWDAASSPAIVAHEHFVQERFQRMAMIIVDVWDTHWCKTAAMRTERLLIPQLNRALRQARKHGMLVIHAPTDIVRFLERNGNVNVERMRQNARLYAEASNSGASHTANITNPHQASARQSNACTRVLPRPAGCMCTADPRHRCEEQYGWSAIHPHVELDPQNDVLIADDLAELISVLDGRQIERVIYAGVHLNLCLTTAKRISMYHLNDSWSRVRHSESPSDRILFARDLVDAFTSHDPARSRTPERGLENAIAFLERDPGGFGSVRLLREVFAVDGDQARLAVAPWGSLLRPHYFHAASAVPVTIETSRIGSGERDIRHSPTQQTIQIEKSGVYLWREAFGTLHGVHLRDTDPVDIRHPDVTAGVYVQVPNTERRCSRCIALAALLSSDSLKETFALSHGANCSVDIVNVASARLDGERAQFRQSRKKDSGMVALSAQCAYRIVMPFARRVMHNTCLCGRVHLRDKVLREHRRGRLHAGRTSAIMTLLDGTRGAVLARTPVLWPHDSESTLDHDAGRVPWPVYVDASVVQTLWVLVQSRSEDSFVQRRYTDIVIRS